MLSQTSSIRAQVEDARLDLLRWIRKRWMGIRQEGGFDALEGWSIKEISQGGTYSQDFTHLVFIDPLFYPSNPKYLHYWPIAILPEIEVPVEDLISPAPHHTLRNPHLSRALRPSLIRGSGDADSDSLSVHSLRASVLSRTIATSKSHGQGRDGNLASSGSSIRSVARSTATLTPPGSARVRNHSTTSRASERPDSKLTPDSASFTSARTGATEKARAHGHVVGHRRSPSMNTTSTRSDDRDSRASEKDDDGDGDDDHDGSTPTPSVTTTPNGRPTLSKIITNNTSSTRSTSLGSKQSTHPVRARHPAIRGSTHQSSHHTTNGLSTLRIPSSTARPSSSLSSATSDTTFRTAPSELITPTSARSRKTSGGSTLSTVSTRTVGTTAKKGPISNAIGSGPGGALTARTRVASGVSITSARTPVRHPDKDTAKISPGSAAKRLPSAGRTTPVAQKKSLGRNVVEKNASQKSSPSPSPRIRRVEIGKERGPKSDNDKENVLSVSPAESLADDDDDTETNLHTVYTAPEVPEQGADPVITPPPVEDDHTSDDTLAGRESSETVVTSTRTPETKSSPELTLTESTLASAIPSGATLDIGIPCIISSKRKRFLSDGRAWCDGSWGGIRYFDIGGNGSEWEFGAGDDTRAPRRRKTEWSNGMSTFKGSGGTKREGDQLHVGLDRMKRMRSASPAASDLSTSESMGLFVRPQQVLYVVDAVGADL
ncbi:hypothetical protein JVT61DRAFT_10514 [Boletus reticuloceps]|uniref:Uncharacterized protein n=1 Tax=Boletus reticuloceps TaxID=495285 RepID=A0A8I2YYA3_9AGAM|nr:hypothetical protein JVT61DRAFT_10514 [Boletus reticuloceps]